MNATLEKKTFRERNPGLFRTPEERRKRNEQFRALLRKFVEEGDPQEQKETGEFLMKALAESRESNREPESK